MASQEPCPCGNSASYARCCGPLHAGVSSAPTAAALMRSRYCAYVMADADYLLKTWHPATRPERLEFHPRQRWLGLKISNVEAGGEDDDAGMVEFVARYKIDGAGQRLHERSEFLRVEGNWVYLQGEFPDR